MSTLSALGAGGVFVLFPELPVDGAEEQLGDHGATEPEQGDYAVDVPDSGFPGVMRVDWPHNVVCDGCLWAFCR